MKRFLLLVALIAALGIIVFILILPLFQPSVKSPKNEALASEKVWQLDFGHNIPVDSALHKASVRYAGLVEEKSGGRVKITIHPAQELGNDHKMVEMARKGELDIILTPTAKMSVALPSIQYADLPFYFPKREDLYEMLDGEPGEMILNGLKDIGLVGVTFWENGFKHFTANSPLLLPDDFKGKKIRVMKSRIIMDQFRSFGATPIPIDFHSTKKALADGVVDGEENPLIAIVSMGFYKVQSDLTLSEHAYLGYVFSISSKTFEKLPSDIRTIMIQSAKEITPWEREETHKKEKELLGIIKNAGVNIHTLSKEERKEFAKKTAHIPKKFEEIIGSDIISKTEEMMLKKYGPSPQDEDHIIIAIDTDLSMETHVSGLAIKRGVELAVKEINEKGGLLGKKLYIIAKNHHGVTSQGIHNVKELTSRPDVAAIVGGLHSGVILAEMDIIQKSSMPYLIPWAAAAEVIDNGYKNNSIFRLSANDNTASEFIIKNALKKHKRPSIMVENSVWGRSNLEKMQNYLKSKNMKFSSVSVFNRGQKSFDLEFKNMMNSGSDSLIIVANPLEGGSIIEKMSSEVNKVPIFSHWGIIGGSFFKDHKKAIKSIDLEFFQTFSFYKNKRASALVKEYMKDYGVDSLKEIKAPAGLVQAYDIVHLLALAVKQAGTTEHSKVLKALENLPPYEGVMKKYEQAFSKNNHDALKSDEYHMAKFAKDGSIVPTSR